MVKFGKPTWTMRNVACSACGEAALQLLACPECRALALGCEECGSNFLDLRAQSAVSEQTLCAGCGEQPLAAFSAATSAEIQAAGLSVSEYA